VIYTAATGVLLALNTTSIIWRCVWLRDLWPDVDLHAVSRDVFITDVGDHSLIIHKP